VETGPAYGSVLCLDLDTVRYVLLKWSGHDPDRPPEVACRIEPVYAFSSV
jgi:hypothetical protein